MCVCVSVTHEQTGKLHITCISRHQLTTDGTEMRNPITLATGVYVSYRTRHTHTARRHTFCSLLSLFHLFFLCFFWFESTATGRIAYDDDHRRRRQRRMIKRRIISIRMPVYAVYYYVFMDETSLNDEHF